MLNVLPFEPGDFAMLERRPFTELELATDYRTALAAGEASKAAGPCFTIWHTDDAGERRPVFCGGAHSNHAEYATLWAAWAKGAEAHALYITKRTRAFVAGCAEKRLDALVGVSNPGAVGWCRLLGLHEEARMQSVYVDGGDAIVMVRIRED